MIDYVRNLDKNKKVSIYNNMYARCYSKKYQQNNPIYKECTMCDEWLDDKQSFYDWVDENYYRYGNEQIDLDKDILVKGNKVYAPNTCIFAPHSINTCFESLTREPVYLEKLKKYRMDIMIDGRNIKIGYFETEEEAKKEFIRHKEAAILAKADLYKSGIPRSLYKAMVSRHITLEDWNK